jgi:hypothetical protein
VLHNCFHSSSTIFSLVKKMEYLIWWYRILVSETLFCQKFVEHFQNWNEEHHTWKGISMSCRAHKCPVNTVSTQSSVWPFTLENMSYSRLKKPWRLHGVNLLKNLCTRRKLSLSICHLKEAIKWNYNKIYSMHCAYRCT